MIFTTNSGVFVPTDCSIYPEKIVTLDEQHYSGLGVGTRLTLSLAFLQTKNWRISFEAGSNVVSNIWDSNFQKVNYRGLDYYPIYASRTSLDCDEIHYSVDGAEKNGNCINLKGEDMSRTNDPTHALQITYYFR